MTGRWHRFKRLAIHRRSSWLKHGDHALWFVGMVFQEPGNGMDTFSCLANSAMPLLEGVKHFFLQEKKGLFESWPPRFLGYVVGLQRVLDLSVRQLPSINVGDIIHAQFSCGKRWRTWWWDVAASSPHCSLLGKQEVFFWRKLAPPKASLYYSLGRSWRKSTCRGNLVVPLQHVIS